MNLARHDATWTKSQVHFRSKRNVYIKRMSIEEM